MSGKQSNKFLTISIPAYNDELSLVKLVDECTAVATSLGLDFDFHIVNDGSTDGTVKSIAELQKRYSNVNAIHHPRNLGFGPTLRDVFTLPQSEWVLFLPGDHQFPASNLRTLLVYKENYDFVLGKRTIRRDSALRLMYAGIYNKLVSLLTGYQVTDVNGIAFYKTTIFEKVKLNSKTSFIHAELFLETNRLGYKVIEVSVEHKEREFGKGSGGKWSVIVPSVMDLLFYVLKKRK
jgi:glycosyltransferase involved in cell wall biosynthesis